MPTATKQTTASFAGRGFANDLGSATFDTSVSGEYTIAAGKAVTSWVKTDADTADCTLPGSHGYTNGKFDVYWTVGGTPGRRYGVDGTISTNALALDGGTGDDFPASSTTGIVVCKRTRVDIAITGSNVQFLAIVMDHSLDTTARGHADIQDSGGTELAATLTHSKEAGGMNYVYDIYNGETNPITGDVIEVAYLSNGSSSQSCTIHLFAGVDQTP